MKNSMVGWKLNSEGIPTKVNEIVMTNEKDLRLQEIEALSNLIKDELDQFEKGAVVMNNPKVLEEYVKLLIKIKGMLYL